MPSTGNVQANPIGNSSNPPLIPGVPIPAPDIPNPLNIFKSASDAVNSTADFLKMVAWIFHPRNWLRAVEFLTGIILIGFGLWAAVQARGERMENFATGESALSRSGLGRVSRELARSSRSENRAARREERAAGAPRVRRAPHSTRRVARQRGMEAAARGGSRSNKPRKSGKAGSTAKKAVKAVPK